MPCANYCKSATAGKSRTAHTRCARAFKPACSSIVFFFSAYQSALRISEIWAFTRACTLPRRCFTPTPLSCRCVLSFGIRIGISPRLVHLSNAQSCKYCNMRVRHRQPSYLLAIQLRVKSHRSAEQVLITLGVLYRSTALRSLAPCCSQHVSIRTAYVHAHLQTHTHARPHALTGLRSVRAELLD